MTLEAVLRSMVICPTCIMEFAVVSPPEPGIKSWNGIKQDDIRRTKRTCSFIGCIQVSDEEEEIKEKQQGGQV